MPNTICRICLLLSIWLTLDSAQANEPVTLPNTRLLTPRDVVWKPLPAKKQAEFEALTAKCDAAAIEGRHADEREIAGQICNLLIRHRSPCYMSTSDWKQRLQEAETICKLSPEDQSVVHMARLALAEGRRLIYQGNFKQASLPIESAIHPLREKLGQSSQSMIALFMQLVARSMTVGPEQQPLAAEWDECEAQYAKYFGASHPIYADVLSLRGRCLVRNGDYDQALKLLEQAQQIYVQSQSTLSPEFLMNCTARATLYAHQRRIPEAELAVRQAISLRILKSDDSVNALYDDYFMLAAILAIQGDTAGALCALKITEQFNEVQRNNLTITTKAGLLKAHILYLQAERQDELAAKLEQELKQWETERAADKETAKEAENEEKIGP